MSLRSRKIWISVVLVVAFFAIAVLMTSSVNLFSLSDSNVKIEYSDLIRNINARGLTAP